MKRGTIQSRFYQIMRDNIRLKQFIPPRAKTVWGSESLLTIGTYSYEYNTQGKTLKKTVTYTPKEVFSSYFIEIQAQADDSTLYVRYEQPYAGEKYVRESSWVYRADGTLAEMRQVDYTYDLTGIVNATANSKVGATLNGRSLSIGEGLFTVAHSMDAFLLTMSVLIPCPLQVCLCHHSSRCKH